MDEQYSGGIKEKKLNNQWGQVPLKLAILLSVGPVPVDHLALIIISLTSD